MIYVIFGAVTVTSVLYLVLETGMLRLRSRDAILYGRVDLDNPDLVSRGRGLES